MASVPKNWEKTSGKAGPQVANYENKILNRFLNIQERMGTYRAALYREKDSLEDPYAVVAKDSNKKEIISKANDYMETHPNGMAPNEMKSDLTTQEQLLLTQRKSGRISKRSV